MCHNLTQPRHLGQLLHDFDSLLKTDPDRKKAYDQLVYLLHSWVDDELYLKSESLHSNTDEEDEEMDAVLRSFEIKRGIAVSNYIKLYSPFQLQDNVQVIRNNRVIEIGNIRDIKVLMHPAISIQKPVVRDDGLVYHLGEFIYRIYYKTNAVTNVPYWKESPFRLLPKPAVMYKMCPICQTQGKPLVDTIIGGTQKVICEDCDNIIKELFGVDYVENVLKYSEIKSLKEYDRIQSFSSRR